MPCMEQAWCTLRSQARLQQAAECFQAAIGHDPKLAAAYSNLGNIYLEEGDLESAAAAYRWAIDTDPECATAYHNLGVLYKQMGNINEGIKYLKKAAKLNRRRPWQGQEPPKLEAVRKIIWLAIIVLLLLIIFKQQ